MRNVAGKEKVHAFSLFIQASFHKENYYSKGTTISLRVPTNDSSTLIGMAKRAVREIYLPGFEYSRCGVGLIDLVSGMWQQQDLFVPQQSTKSEVLMSVLDDINSRYGRDTIVTAAEGLEGRWRMRQDYLSPSYTTNWLSLPVINCFQ